jgi:hypothetical protein
MPFPKPVPGLVIRYSFLWSHEATAGDEDGSKDRPCAVLLATTTEEGQQMVTVLPVTHTPPTDERLAVEIPAGTKTRLGLDVDRSWIILNEANRFQWPGPDLRPIPGDKDGHVAYGLLPARLYDLVRTKWLAAFDARQVGQVNRTS